MSQVKIPVGDFGKLPELCKSKDGSQCIRNILMSNIGDLSTMERRRCIYDGMSEAYRRDHVQNLAVFLYYGIRGATRLNQPLAQHIMQTLSHWFLCAQERNFEEGLCTLRAAALEVGADCKLFEPGRWWPNIIV